MQQTWERLNASLKDLVGGIVAPHHVYAYAHRRSCAPDRGLRLGLSHPQLQARSHVAAVAARGVRTLVGAAVWAVDGVRGGERLVRAAAASAAGRCAECWEHGVWTSVC
jgi:hypothetical protein